MRILLLPVLLSMAWTQEAPPAPAKPKGPPPEPKNLKVLKATGSELMPIMREYSLSLGVRCDHCHIKGNFASDENPHKDIARTMIAMTQEANAKLGDDGKARVGCFTCHRGEIHPQVTAPPPPPKPAP